MKNFSNSYQKFILGLDEINHAVDNHIKDFIDDIEKCYDSELVKVVEYILSLKGKRVIVMISGPSASGKTTTALMLKEKLKKHGSGAALISLDNFYKDRSKCKLLEDGLIDYESPDALDIQQFRNCMEMLLEKGYCHIPIFNFIEKKPNPQKAYIELKENEIAIIEGIHGLNPVFTKGLPDESVVRIYISVKQGISDYNGQVISNREIRLIRRLVRDYDKRKSDPENTLNMWKNVCKGQTTFIYPFKRSSDITINSLHLYELGAMKNIAIPLLKQIQEDSPVFKDAFILLSTLERFHSIDTSLIPNSSMIREFIGNSIYDD